MLLGKSVKTIKKDGKSIKEEMPIEWIVLEKGKEEMILLSKECIGLCDYDHLDDYLSNEMMKYFNDEEKERIQKIFILNREEIERYLPNKKKREAKVFEHLKGEKILISDGTYGPIQNTWYLLAPDDPDASFIPAINLNGEVYNEGMYVRHVPCGIRVALKVTK